MTRVLQSSKISPTRRARERRVTKYQLLREQSELRIWQHGALFIFACIILISRRPDAVFHAQFFAEDGRVWFADAYNIGWWNALLRAQDGYFQTLPRLAAAIALLVPLSLAPLVLNLVALIAEVLPVHLLLSSRSAAWGSLRFRALLAVVYLALPNSREMIIILTSSQWILTFGAFLLLVGTAPAGTTGRALDLLVLALCGLTGPFCFFLMPIAIFIAWKCGGRWNLLRAGVLFGSVLIQAWGLLVVDASARSHSALGASPSLFVRILGGQIYFATLVGGNSLAVTSGTTAFLVLVCALVFFTVFISICFVRTGFEMRLFLVLTTMLLIGSLISPVAYPPPGVSRWELLAHVSGIRYWFFPTLACAWSLLWAVRSRTGALRATSAFCLCAMCFGVTHDWKVPALQDLHFTDFARRFEIAPAGTELIIPENPDGWNLKLVKHVSLQEMIK